MTVSIQGFDPQGISWGAFQQQTAIVSGNRPYTLWTTSTVNLSFNAWASSNSNNLTNIDGQTHLIVISWFYNEGSNITGFCGADVIGGSAGMGNPLAFSQDRMMCGGGRFGERIDWRLSYGSGKTGQLDFYYFGRAGYNNTSTSPIATIKVYRMTI